VAKNAVMESDKDDCRTLRDAVLTEFKDQNSTKDVDCTAMKVNWLSKSHLSDLAQEQGRGRSSVATWGRSVRSIWGILQRTRAAGQSELMLQLQQVRPQTSKMQ
jgi:hypothetical protein